MERYEIRIKRAATKEIEVVATKKDRRRIVRRIQALADDPRPPGREKLSGRALYRVRQGPYRVVYTVDDVARIVLVVKVGHRRDVCR
jgi:mRNA interferase RelE/StbE